MACATSSSGWRVCLVGFSALFFFVVVVIAALVEDEIGRMEKGTLFSADVHERRLDARENRFDFTEVNVANHPPGFGTVDE